MEHARHWFISDSDGALHDTRRANWSSRPVRLLYRRHCTHIESGPELLASLRAGEHTFPGAYRLAFMTHDSATLSFAAVRDNLREVIRAVRHATNDGWQVVGLIIVSEFEEPVHCDHTGELLND